MAFILLKVAPSGVFPRKKMPITGLSKIKVENTDQLRSRRMKFDDICKRSLREEFDYSCTLGIRLS